MKEDDFTCILESSCNAMLNFYYRSRCTYAHTDVSSLSDWKCNWSILHYIWMCCWSSYEHTVRWTWLQCGVQS